MGDGEEAERPRGLGGMLSQGCSTRGIPAMVKRRMAWGMTWVLRGVVGEVAEVPGVVWEARLCVDAMVIAHGVLWRRKCRRNE